MKKLLCLSLFMMGIFISVEAQTLSYQLINNSSNEWTYGMEDNNGNTLLIPQISANTTVTGTFNNFELPLRWRAYDQGNACPVSGTITAPGGVITPAYFCTGTSGISLQLTQNGNDYNLQVVFQ